MIVRPTRDAEEVAKALELRRRVFSLEQGVSERADRDGRDHEAIHVVAFEEGVLRGTCRVLIRQDVAALGRLAVARGERRRGVGRAILAEAERAARAGGARRVALHAQLPAERFYTREGYTRGGHRSSSRGSRT